MQKCYKKSAFAFLKSLIIYFVQQVHTAKHNSFSVTTKLLNNGEVFDLDKHFFKF